MITMMFLFMFLLSYLTGVWIYCSKRKHLLVMLLSLEYMVLFSYLIMLIWLSLMEFMMYFSMIYLVFSVCEGALGLGILVCMVRSYGNDYLQSFVILRC